eukprot:gene1257-11346_t
MFKQIPIILLLSSISFILMLGLHFMLNTEEESPLEGIVVGKDGWSLGTKDIIIFCSTLLILSKLTKNMNIKILGIDISWNNVEQEVKTEKKE